jgi:hypothetical protein
LHRWSPYSILKVIFLIIPLMYIRNMRLREVEKLTQHHIAKKSDG